MKADDLNLGDKVDGWTVMGAKRGDFWALGFMKERVVLLTLERTVYGESYYHDVVEYWRDDVTETRTAWFRADDEVML